MAVSTFDWQLEVERGPNWLFIRVIPPDDTFSSHGDSPEPELLGPTWTLLEQHFTYRVVLELDDVLLLSSQQIGELIVLEKRIRERGGLLKLCGLSAAAQQSLRLCRLGSQFHNHCDREEAVLGVRKPR